MSKPHAEKMAGLTGIIACFISSSCSKALAKSPTSAAKAHEGKIARIVSALNRNLANRERHVHVGQVDDAIGGVNQR